MCWRHLSISLVVVEQERLLGWRCLSVAHKNGVCCCGAGVRRFNVTGGGERAGRVEVMDSMGGYVIILR